MTMNLQNRKARFAKSWQTALFALKCKFFLEKFREMLDNNMQACYNKNIKKRTKPKFKNEKEPLKMEKNWYIEAIESTLSEQRSEID